MTSSTIVWTIQVLMTSRIAMTSNPNWSCMYVLLVLQYGIVSHNFVLACSFCMIIIFNTCVRFTVSCFCAFPIHCDVTNKQGSKTKQGKNVESIFCSARGHNNFTSFFVFFANESITFTLSKLPFKVPSALFWFLLYSIIKKFGETFSPVLKCFNHSSVCSLYILYVCIPGIAIRNLLSQLCPGIIIIYRPTSTPV
jgi:hypothetical protein